MGSRAGGTYIYGRHAFSRDPTLASGRWGIGPNMLAVVCTRLDPLADQPFVHLLAFARSFAYLLLRPPAPLPDCSLVLIFVRLLTGVLA